jgi:hypothetical protein
LVIDPGTTWPIEPPRALTTAAKRSGPVLWIVPERPTIPPTRPSTVPIRLAAGQVAVRRAAGAQAAAPGALSGWNPAGRLSVNRSTAESVAGWVTVAVTAGALEAVGGSSASARSGRKSACAGAAVIMHSAAASPAVRAVFNILMLASAFDAWG